MSNATKASASGSDADQQVKRFRLSVGTLPFVRIGERPKIIAHGFEWLDFHEETPLIERLLKKGSAVASVEFASRDDGGFAIPIFDPDMEGIAPGLVSGAFSLELVLPKEGQELPAQYSGPITESLSAVYDGMSFAFWTEASEWTESHIHYEIGLFDQVRSELSTNLSKDPRFGVPKTTYAGPELVVDLEVFLLDSPAFEEPRTDSWDTLTNRRVKVEAARSHWSFEEIARRIAREMLLDLLQYQEAKQIVALRDMTIRELLESSKAVANDFGELTSYEWWQIWRFSKFSKIQDIRKRIATAITEYVFLMQVNSIHSSRAFGFPDALESSGTLHGCRTLIDRVGQSPPIDVDAILKSLQFFQDESRSTLGIETAVLATIVAAMVSTILVAAFQLL